MLDKWNSRTLTIFTKYESNHGINNSSDMDTNMSSHSTIRYSTDAYVRTYMCKTNIFRWEF